MITFTTDYVEDSYSMVYKGPTYTIDEIIYPDNWLKVNDPNTYLVRFKPIGVSDVAVGFQLLSGSMSSKTGEMLADAFKKNNPNVKNVVIVDNPNNNPNWYGIVYQFEMNGKNYIGYTQYLGSINNNILVTHFLLLNLQGARYFNDLQKFQIDIYSKPKVT